MNYFWLISFPPGTTLAASLRGNDQGRAAAIVKRFVFPVRERKTIVPQPLRQPNVFVVDDEEVIASSLAMILQLHGGFHARSFTKPLEALQAARLESPDLLIADVVMPLLSGIELAIQVQKHCPGCKVLLFSGQAATSHLLEAARARGYDFELLSKPVHPADLLAKIRDLTEPTPSLQSTQELQT